MEACASAHYGNSNMNKERFFPWTFDQYHRYSVIRAALKFFFKEQSPRVLDVGGVSPQRGGRGFWFPIREIIPDGSYVLDKSPVSLQGYIQGDAAHLPFKDNSVDVVSALDVLEHVKPQKREGVLEELGRVSQDVVLISVPKATKDVEIAEDMLYDQVKKLYQIDHTQLREHRRYGLPQRETVSEILKSIGFSQSHFSYGSLTNWMFFQSLKHGFLFQSESDFILEEIDWFETHYLKESEFEPPFIRQFWAASKKRNPRELEKGIDWIRNELKQESGKSRKETEKEVERLAQFSQELTRIFSRERVTVVILAEAGVNPLKECLKHMLSQKVYFDFEVCVLNVAEDPDIRYLIKAFYPHVKYLSWNAQNSRKFKEQMLELLCELQGDYILFLDEARLLPQDSVTQIFERVRENPKISVINSDIQWVFMRRKIFSRLDGDESQMKRKVKKMNKDDILMTLRRGFKESHRD